VVAELGEQFADRRDADPLHLLGSVPNQDFGRVSCEHHGSVLTHFDGAVAARWRGIENLVGSLALAALK